VKIKNVSSVGDLDLPVLGRRVAAGEVFEFPADVGELLIAQPANFVQVEKESK
jgi:hypothetical protein